MISIIVLALLWSTWCILHSVLIAPTVTDFWKHRLGSGFRFYRLFYNGVALGTFIPVWLYGESFPDQTVWVHWEGWLRIRAISVR